jgi:hypothetical protein
MVADVENCALLTWSTFDMDGDVVATFFTLVNDSSPGGSSIMQLTSSCKSEDRALAWGAWNRLH